MTTEPAFPPTDARGTALEVLVAFLSLGLASFGGPDRVWLVGVCTAVICVGGGVVRA